MNKFERHFTRIISRTPSSRTCLERICRSYARNGFLPKRIALDKRCDSIAPELVELFGAEPLVLSSNGQIRLVTDIVLAHFEENEKRQWLEGIHHVCGMHVPGSESDINSNDHELMIEKWRLAFHDLAEIIPFLEREKRRLVKHSDEPPEDILRQWFTSANIVRFLRGNSEAMTLSDCGARLCGNSKALRVGPLGSIVADWLILLDSAGTINPELLDTQQRKTQRYDALRRHGIVENRSGIWVTVFGPLRYRKAGMVFDHVEKAWEAGEAAILTLENLLGIDELILPSDIDIYTSENESPFCNLVRSGFKGLLLYTQGFPNTAVCRLYRLVSSVRNHSRCFHWGDTDFAGLRIAWILHQIHPLELWRCDVDAMEENKKHLLPLPSKIAGWAKHFLNQNPDFPFSEELRFSLAHGWLEQEQYYACERDE